MQQRYGLILAISAVLMLGAGSGQVHAEALLSAAGSTFAYPLYSKSFKTYSRESAEAKFTSDGPMTDEQLRNAPGRLLHIPVALGAVVATYNLPGNADLLFTRTCSPMCFWERYGSGMTGALRRSTQALASRISI